MHVPLWVWLVTGLVFLGLFFFDFFTHVRTPHEPTFRESAFWSSFYIGLALVFGIAVVVAIPTGTRRRPVAASASDENPADTFEEDDNA